MVLIIDLFSRSDSAPSAVAFFSDDRCEADGVCPNDPLSFTCELSEILSLRLVLPNGAQEVVSVGDDEDDIALPNGFTANSLVITENDGGSSRNFVLTLSITTASLLAGSEIRCDDTTNNNVAMDRCPLQGVPPAPSNLRQVTSSNTASTATITWDSAGDGVNYSVTSSSLPSQVTGINNVSYTLTHLQVETDYSVTVTATNECGNESPPSNTTIRINVREPLPLMFGDPLIGCGVTDDELRTPVTVSWMTGEVDSTTSPQGLVAAPITSVSVFYTDPMTGENVTGCAALSGEQKTCSFSLQLSEDVSVVSVFANASNIAGYTISTNKFQTDALLVEYFLDTSSPPLGLRATLNPLCDSSNISSSLFVQGLFGVKKSPDSECTYLQSSTQSLSDSNTVFIDLDLDLRSSDYRYCATAILNGREKTLVDGLSCESNVDVKECDSASVGLSPGATAGIIFTITLLVVLPVGVVLGCCGLWCRMRYSGGPTSGGGPQKVEQLQAAIYEEPSPVETAIPLTDNQAYSPVNINSRNL